MTSFLAGTAVVIVLLIVGGAALMMVGAILSDIIGGWNRPDAYGIPRRNRHTAPGHWPRMCNCEKCVTWPNGRP